MVGKSREVSTNSLLDDTIVLRSRKSENNPLKRMMEKENTLVVITNQRNRRNRLPSNKKRNPWRVNPELKLSNNCLIVFGSLPPFSSSFKASSLIFSFSRSLLSVLAGSSVGKLSLGPLVCGFAAIKIGAITVSLCMPPPVVNLCLLNFLTKK